MIQIYWHTDTGTTHRVTSIKADREYVRVYVRMEMCPGDHGDYNGASAFCVRRVHAMFVLFASVPRYPQVMNSAATSDHCSIVYCIYTRLEGR